jgi:hypothetical protein
MVGSEALRRSKTASERLASRIETSAWRPSGTSGMAAAGGSSGGRREPGLVAGQDPMRSSSSSSHAATSLRTNCRANWPHPHHGSDAHRRANRRSRSSHDTVGTAVMGPVVVLEAPTLATRLVVDACLSRSGHGKAKLGKFDGPRACRTTVSSDNGGLGLPPQATPAFGRRKARIRR